MGGGNELFYAKTNLCDTSHQFHGHCGKNLILVRRNGSVLICPMWKGREHKI